MPNTTEPRRRARVLQLAYACSPLKGSEPGVGWNRAVQAAKHSEVCVITEATEFQSQILSYLDEHGLVDGLSFVFVPKTKLERQLSRMPGVYYLAYRMWHRRAFEAAKRLHAEQRFDLLHQVNMCGYREPGLLWKVGPPFIWGPIGGTQNHPWWLLAQAGIRGAIEEAVRGAMNWLQLRTSLRVRAATQRAALLLVANSTIQRQFGRVFDRETKVMCEIGSKPVERKPAQRAGDRLRLLWAGEFRAFKALPLLLEAMATASNKQEVRLRVMGDGPQRTRWQRIATRLGIGNQIEWLGWLPHAEALDQYEWADLFTFTSLRDTSGSVVLEALSRGIPVLAVDHQGVGDIVTGECGIKVPLSTKSDIIAGMRRAIERCSADDFLPETLSQGASRRARDYCWEEQGQRMRDHYRAVLGDGFDWSFRKPSKEVIPADVRSVALEEVT